MKNDAQRRTFIRNLGLLGIGASVSPILLQSCGGASQKSEETVSETSKDMFFKISLAQWSLHKMLFAGELDNLDFAKFTKDTFDIHALEYVNAFFKDKAKDTDYLGEMKKRVNDLGMESVLIMVDGEGFLGDLDQKARMKSVDDHKKWVEAAKFLGCHSIRVNAFGRGTAEEVGAAATDGLRNLSEFAKPHGINVIVENHGSYSSNGQWLTQVIQNTGMDNCGTLPDFGNFCVKRSGETEWEGECVEEYDRYQGVKEMMPFAKGVSAKANNFDAEGNCVETDFYKMMQIVKDAGYTGYVGIEYEGNDLSEVEGIKATKALLERVGMEIS
ncbi:sugar phosphate isomerase/epimerase family protein [Arthrospiribacter ruber]|uniref:Sugar phosphate isomerase/epimerase n=1 Tax=Arthrospiribacter ruber TaxID=2487934 RepID=A0A951MFP7_9BACT|nr:TIM barrel protein [Arthrospiribacter ruber]MBW3470022.1 sugar phosphate isomerase/epimerase [Arthrospiribacter ruber]